MNQLREHMRNYMTALAENLTESNVVSFAQRRSQHSEVLDLINQAAEIIKTREDRAAQKEQQALDVASRAVEELGSAERQLRAAIDARQVSDARACATENMAASLHAKAHHFDKMLKDAHSIISALQSQLGETEARAEAAERRVREAYQTIADVQDAIRTKLFGNIERERRSSVAAA